MHITGISSVCLASIMLAGCSWTMGEKTQEAEKVKSEQPAVTKVSEQINNEMKLAQSIFSNKDCVKAFQTFQKYAVSGDAEAEAWLGRCYMNGIGTSVDIEKAYHYFQLAAEKNNPWGINGLGVCYQYGFGTAVDLQTAKELYSKAANLNHPLATLNLARTYADQEGGFFDAAQAEVYFKKAVELEAISAKRFYASFLFGQKRYAEAIPLLKASINEPSSMAMMAQCYENGWGVPVDISRAVDIAEEHFKKFGSSPWSAEICFNAGLEEIVMNGRTEYLKRCMRLAADQDHQEAQYYYATLLEKDNDRTGALKYMLKSADNGHVFAMTEAGKMLVERKDFKRAAKYFSMASLDLRTKGDAVGYLADMYHTKLNEHENAYVWDLMGADLGLDYSRNKLAVREIYQNGDEHFAKAAALFAISKTNNNEFAIKWINDILSNDYERLRILADKNNPDALFALGIIGCLEEKGHPNISVGMKLLERAAKLNHAEACYVLGNIYHKGIFVEKDLKKAIEWYNRGAVIGHKDAATTAAQMLFYEKEFAKTKPEDVQKAFDLCLKLDEFSIAFEYGYFLENVVKDNKKAEEMYRISAAHNDPRAMIRLHDIFFKTNADESFQHLWDAIDLRSAVAELRMGEIQAVWENPRRSFIYYLRADIDGDNVTAPYHLAKYWLNGYGCEVNLNCFWNAADKSYKNGSADVCFLLGTVYKEGKICPKDLKKAKSYLEEGAKRGSEECKKALADF